MVPTEGGSSPPSAAISRNRTRTCTPATDRRLPRAYYWKFFPRVLFVKSSRTAFERLYRIEPARPLAHTCHRGERNQLSDPKDSEEQFMLPFRIMAIPTEVAQAVRTTLHAPGNGFPAPTD